MRSINVRVPSETYDGLKNIAEDEGLSVSDIVRRAIRRYLVRPGGARP